MAVGSVYDKYSTNSVFQYLFANIICNKLMQGLINENFENFNDHFGLSGDAATCYLSSDSGPIQNIQFQTDVREIYIFIARNLQKICPELLKMQSYEERIVAYFSGFYIEFYLEDSITTSDYFGIYTTITSS